MRRRLLFAALACSAGAALRAQDESPRPHQKISAAELHRALSSRFPLRVGAPGLLEVLVSAPRLLLLPARNQLGATLQAVASGSQLHRPQRGEMDAVFSLRYEASDQTVRGHHLDVLDLRWPGLSPQGLQTMQQLLPALARDALGEIVLHRFSPRELALPDTMGFQPETLTVLEDGLDISFGLKPRR
jgi:hypothetical protein